ncbi:hypothetical protein GCM10009535_18790 [Streptomyces thermocarboxydovorans]|uniref:BLUF domain-containing protein n=1 Tax=Streptomyces thermocarboxydovorans TaxID=59298 RepID=A0ABP3SIK3_9ACTN
MSAPEMSLGAGHVRVPAPGLRRAEPRQNRPAVAALTVSPPPCAYLAVTAADRPASGKRPRRHPIKFISFNAPVMLFGRAFPASPTVPHPGTATGDTDGEGIALIQLIASGAPMAEDLAEGRLRYRMARWHVGLVLWIDDPQQADALDKAIAVVRSASGGRSALVARASATSRWIWLSGEAVPDLRTQQGAAHSRTGAIRGMQRIRRCSRLGRGACAPSLADRMLLVSVTLPLPDRAAVSRTVSGRLRAGRPGVHGRGPFGQ